ncbi:MAG: flavin reductase family protein [Thaumarchaeota archaeon]|nr:flavin reductase family protein [Nitrososphaerota archaeon]
MPVSEDPPMIALSLRKESYTGELIKKSGEFTVNIPDERLLKALWLCGTRSGRRINKFKRANLTSIPS